MFKPLMRRFSEHDEENGYNTLYLYHRLSHYIKPYWWRVLIAFVITVPIGALDASIVLALKPYMDGVVLKNSIQHLAYIPFLIIGLTVVQGILNYFSIYLTGWLGFNIASDIRQDLFRKLLVMDVRYFDVTPSGLVLQRYYNDPASLQMNLLENTKLVLVRFFSSVGLICTLVYLSWQLSIVAVGVLLLILYPSSLIRQVIKNMAKEMTLSSGKMLAMYNESVSGIKIIYGYNMVQAQVKKFREIQRSLFDRTMKKVKAQGLMTPSMHIIAAVGIAIVIWQGSNQVIHNHMTPGSLVSFIAALIMLYNPIKNLGSSIMNTQLAFLAADRVFSILDKVPTITNKPGAKKITQIKDNISFENVSFSYTSMNKAVLRKFNLTIPKGETIALVGSSGSGKSTIANLIPRFYDIKVGAVKIDGVNIQDFKLESLRSMIGIVMQDSFMFDGTIRENILVGKPDATDEALYDAVEKAYLKDFVLSISTDGTMESGLNREVGERGVMLSGGQRQRISIARVLLRDAAIVILDEATSALDNQSEAIVQSALESLMKDRTVIVIAHRLSTIRNANRIVVLDQGRIVEEGVHNELILKPNGVYAALYHKQFNTLEEDAPALAEAASAIETVSLT